MTEIDLHDSDCATHNEPAYPNGPCDCSLLTTTERDNAHGRYDDAKRRNETKMINPDELERLARAATPGPWVWEDEDLLNPEMRERRQRVIKSEPYEGQWIDTESADAAFIAAANPATILALLSANREMREREHRLDRALTLALDYLGELEPGDSRAVSDEYVAMLAVLCRVEPNEPGGEMAIINAAISAREARSALLTTQVREG